MGQASEDTDLFKEGLRLRKSLIDSFFTVPDSGSALALGKMHQHNARLIRI